MTRESAASALRLLAPPARVSRRGVEFVAAFEGYVGHVYNDVAGNATIGYGHLIHRGPASAGDRARWGALTREGALLLLAGDLADVEAELRAGIRPRLRSQSRFDAIASAVFNLGPGVLERSSTLGARLNTFSRAGVAEALLLYDHAGGIEVPGLARRRRAEAELWTHGDYRGAS